MTDIDNSDIKVATGSAKLPNVGREMYQVDGEMLREEKAKAASDTPATDSKGRELLEYAKRASQTVHSASACALAAYGAIMARRLMAEERLDALRKLVNAKEALKQKEAFYLLGTDPGTQLPYINGKNEAIREAQLVALTKAEREAVDAAEVAFAEAESKEDCVADEMDLRVATLYCHASHAFPEFSIGGKLPETVKSPAEKEAAAEQPPQQ